MPTEPNEIDKLQQMADDAIKSLNLSNTRIAVVEFLSKTVVNAEVPLGYRVHAGQTLLAHMAAQLSATRGNPGSPATSLAQLAVDATRMTLFKIATGEIRSSAGADVMADDKVFEARLTAARIALL